MFSWPENDDLPQSQQSEIIRYVEEMSHITAKELTNLCQGVWAKVTALKKVEHNDSTDGKTCDGVPII